MPSLPQMDEQDFAERVHVCIRGAMPVGHGNALKEPLSFGKPRLSPGQENWSQLIVDLARDIAAWLEKKQVNPDTIVLQAEIAPTVLLLKMSARPQGEVC